MIKAKHNILLVKFFDYYIHKILKKSFHSINYPNNFTFNKDKSILFISNHFSWWDGFFAYFINNMIFKKKFHVMMLKKELEKRIIFSSIGAFSIERKSEDVEETLIYICDLLKDPNNFVLIFPQGRLESNHKTNVFFRKGIEYVIKNSKEKIQAVYSTILIDYFEHRRPSAYIYLKVDELSNDININQLEDKYNEHYELSKKEQNSKFK